MKTVFLMRPVMGGLLGGIITPSVLSDIYHSLRSGTLRSPPNTTIRSWVADVDVGPSDLGENWLVRVGMTKLEPFNSDYKVPQNFLNTNSDFWSPNHFKKLGN